MSGTSKDSSQKSGQGAQQDNMKRDGQDQDQESNKTNTHKRDGEHGTEDGKPTINVTKDAGRSQQSQSQR